METVRASEELAQGQMASGRSPLDWKALRNESHEVRDPATQHTGHATLIHTYDPSVHLVWHTLHKIVQHTLSLFLAWKFVIHSTDVECSKVKACWPAHRHRNPRTNGEECINSTVVLLWNTSATHIKSHRFYLPECLTYRKNISFVSRNQPYALFWKIHWAFNILML